MTDLIIKRIEETPHRIVFHVDSFGSPFTRSNGTVLARIYERLTKRSRRNEVKAGEMKTCERAYRHGVYDGFKALQQELE